MPDPKETQLAMMTKLADAAAADDARVRTPCRWRTF
jgi:hypothetical protein